MPAQIVVVERPRGGILGRLRGANAWLRAAWRRDALVPGRRSPARRVRPLEPASAGGPPNASADVGSDDPVGAPQREPEGLAEIFAELGAISARSRDGMLRFELEAGAAPGVLRRLRDAPALGFDRLLDLTVVDQIDRTGRLEVVYLCEASARGERVRIHVPLMPDAPEIESVVGLWPAADWLEREAWDLFGIRFRGHPGLQRLLLPGDFEGAPLRRDFVAASPPSVEIPR